MKAYRQALSLLVATFFSSAATWSATPTEIAAALLPLPEQLRAGAAVVQIESNGRVHELRPGTNGMICIADLPGDDVFDVRCYHKNFISVVFRALEIRRSGNPSGRDVSDIVAEEINGGRLKLSNAPSAGYRCEGPIKQFDAARNALGPDIECWESVHFPFRTAQELGLVEESQISEEQKKHVPYVMSSGTYWSHVMIEHPRKN